MKPRHCMRCHKGIYHPTHKKIVEHLEDGSRLVRGKPILKCSRCGQEINMPPLVYEKFRQQLLDAGVRVVRGYRHASVVVEVSPELARRLTVDKKPVAAYSIPFGKLPESLFVRGE